MKSVTQLQTSRKRLNRSHLLSTITKKALPILLVVLFVAQIISPFIVSAQSNYNVNTGPSKQPIDSNAPVVHVDTWSDLEELGDKQEQGDAYVISGDYTIKLDRDLVAYSPIIITGNVHISADSDKTIYRRKTDDNTVNNFTVFTVNQPGTLTLGNKITMSAKVAETLSMYVITLTDGYGTTLKTIEISSDDERTPLEILQSLDPNLSDESDEGKANILALIIAETGEDQTSPYNTNGYTLENYRPWDMKGQRDNSMALVVKKDLLIKARWHVQEKILTLRVTDGAGNTLFTSNDKTKKIVELMEENGLNANAVNESETVKNAIARLLDSSAESPANDNNYSFKEWNSGGVDMTETLTQIDGNVVVCADWEAQEIVWEPPKEIKEDVEMKIQAVGYYMGVNMVANKPVTTWKDDEDSEGIVWVLKNVAVENGRTTFEIHNQLHPEQKLCVNKSANNGGPGSSTNPGDFIYSTTITDKPGSLQHYRFYFEKVGNQSFLACYDTFQHPQDPSYLKTVYLIGKDQQAIFFCDGTGHEVNAHAGVPTKEYPNPDTPGRTEVAGPGTPGGVQDVAGPYGPSGATSSKMPIKSGSVTDVRYTREGANNTQIFVKDGEGFFVQVNNGGTLDIEGASLQDLKTGLLKNNNNDREGIWWNSTVQKSAPVVVNGGTLKFTDGAIKNNEVGYLPNDNKSGMMAQGNNPEDRNGVENFLKNTGMLNTAGGIIFKNGAKGEITGTASIDHNKGDTGGIIVQGENTDVAIGATLPAESDTKYNVVDGGHIDSNVGFHHAGAALVEDGATLRMVGPNSTMNNNVTWAKGGAVWATEFGTSGYAQINYSEKRLVNTKIKEQNEEGIFIMLNGTMDNNTAFLRGGAINIESNHVHLLGGTISSNYSRVLGGGIYVEGDFPDYTYSLLLDTAYIGHNYAVRYWELDDANGNDISEVAKTTGNNGKYDEYTVSKLNDILDRKLGNHTGDYPLEYSDKGITPDLSGEIAKGNGYPYRTADTRAYYPPHAGAGGGVWLCPIGGTAIFHLHNDHEVIVDDNYASGNNAADLKKGTDLYLHSGTGHLLVSNDSDSDNDKGENWYNESNGKQIPDPDSTEKENAYSGPLYLINNTDNRTDYNNTKNAYNQLDFNATQAAYYQSNGKNNLGVRIIDNVSRDGGGIAANGTLLFGAPKDIYRHEAALGFKKIWPTNANTYPVTFKMFYIYDIVLTEQGSPNTITVKSSLLDAGNGKIDSTYTTKGKTYNVPDVYIGKDAVPQLEGYEFDLNGVAGDSDDYEKSPETTTPNQDGTKPGGKQSNGEYHWTANTTIPIAVETIDANDKSISLPLYKLEYTGDQDTVELEVGGYEVGQTPKPITVTIPVDENGKKILDPSKEEHMKIIYALAREKQGNVFVNEDKFRIAEWNIVIKEYNSVGMEIKEAEFSGITSGKVVLTKDDDVTVIDAGGLGKKIKGYSIGFTEASFSSTAKNGEGPSVEKYINNKVHDYLGTFDEMFEYSIMAYVPFDAVEVVIEDTLVDSLMFVDNKLNFPGNAYVPPYVKDNYGQFLLSGNTYDVVTNGLEYWLVASENEYYKLYYPEKNSNNELTYFSSIAEKPETKRKNISPWATYKKGISAYKGTAIVDNSSLNGYGLVIVDDNNHKGNGLSLENTNSGTVTKHVDATYFSNHPEQHLNGPINNNTIEIGRYDGDTFVVDPTGNTIRVTISNEMLNGEASGSTDNQVDAHGKWIILSYNAMIKPQYRSIEELRKELSGWITEEVSKKGSVNFISELEESENITVTKLFHNSFKGLYYALGEENSNRNKKHYYVYVSVSPDKIRNMDDGKQPHAHDDGNLKDKYVAGEWYELYKMNDEGHGRYRSIYYNDCTDVNLWEAYYKEPDVNSNGNITTEYKFAEDVTYNSVINLLNNSTGNSTINNHSVTFEDVYNYPVIEGKNPHAGIKNQADYIITYPDGGKSKYKTNIVTVEVNQPEKYVNEKVHEVLRHDTSTKGSFDQPFEYEIMVYVPEDAEEIIIWDTLRKDLMFVDRHGKTQYKTYTIGTSENDDFDNPINDIKNSEFMVARLGDANISQSMTSNTTAIKTGNGWNTINDFNLEDSANILQAAQGPKNIFIRTIGDNYYYKRIGDGNEWIKASDTTDPTSNYISTRINDPQVTQLDLTITNAATEKMLETFNTNNHKGDGTGTVSENTGTAFSKPITAGNILVNGAPTDTNNVTFPSENDTTGNTIYLKIDADSGIEDVKGKWVKFAFNAQIRPSKYAEVVAKINKSNRHTKNAAQAVDPNNPAGYEYRLSTHTSEIINAEGYFMKYNDVPDGSKEGFYIKDGNGDFTVYTSTKPNEGIDYIQAYKAAYTYYTDKFEKLPPEVKANNQLYNAIYLRKGWNDTEPNISWEKVTDDGYVIDGEKLYKPTDIYKYIDVQEDGSHAGLANDANYAVKVDNKWHYSTTNTVTVVPLLRTLTFNKVWIVDNIKDIPTAKVLKDNLRLYWEKIDNVVPTSSDHGKTVGDITDLYKDNISITAETIETQNGSIRYRWKIEIIDLPQLRPSMKYYLEEKLIDGFDWADYTNPEDPEATEHAHDKGIIINSEESRPDETYLLVTKKWNVGGQKERNEIDNKTIEVQLMATYNGETHPVYERDSNDKVVFNLDSNGSYVLGSDGNYYLTLPNGVTDADPTKKYSPIVDSNSKKTIAKSNNWVEEWRPIPRFAKDVNGNNLYVLDNNNNQVLDSDNKPIPVEIEYSVKILSDPEGYILSTSSKKNVNYHFAVTNNLDKAYKYEVYTYLENSAPNGRNPGTYKRAEVIAVEKITKKYVENDHELYWEEVSRVFLEGNELKEELAKLNAEDREYFEETCRNGAITTTELPETPGIGVIQDRYSYACYFQAAEEYPSYEVDIVNTEPQIEKYINNDVHLETFYANDIPYDIIVYVPDEATEIEITDELMPTLVLKSFLEPQVSGGDSRYVYGHKEHPISNLPETMQVAIHAENNHLVHGTVDIKKSNVTQNTVSGTATAKIVADENGFKLQIKDIVHYGTDYVKYEYGEYVRVANGEGKDIKFVKENEIPSGYFRRDEFRYRKENSTYYSVNNETGTYIRVKDSNNANYHYVEKGNLPSGYTQDGTDKFEQLTAVDQKIGGRYVQVSFKARFNLDEDAKEAMKNWVENPLSKYTEKPEFNWDVITAYSDDKDGNNKGWDDYIASFGYTKGTNMYVLDKNVAGNPFDELAMLIGSNEISKIAKSSDPEYYLAENKDGKQYLYPVAGNQSDDLKNRWLIVEGGPVYKNLDGSIAYQGAIGVGLGGIDQYRHNQILSYLDSNNIKTLSTTFVPVEPDKYVYIKDKYYLKDVADKYAPSEDYDKTNPAIYRKIDWGRGDGDIIRTYQNNFKGDKYTGDHAGIVNTASYEVTYGNGYKSNHKSNTVTVVPNVYELPSSGGMGTFLFNILGAMFITLALTELMSNRRKRKKSI